MRELPQPSEPAARGATNSSDARLKAQLTAAADSIKDTIAEGCGAATKKDFARFLDMSIKSANEAEAHRLEAPGLPLASGLALMGEMRQGQCGTGP